jgi:hypothetical protein
MSFQLLKNNNSDLVPATDSDKEKLDKVERGEVFTCKRVSKRNIKLHRKYFALINLAFENLPERFVFPNPDSLRDELTIAAGFYEIRKDFNGNEYRVAKSVSFDAMPSDEEFDVLFSRTLDLVCRLIGTEESDVIDQLIEFM